MARNSKKPPGLLSKQACRENIPTFGEKLAAKRNVSPDLLQKSPRKEKASLRLGTTGDNGEKHPRIGGKNGMRR